MRKRSERQLQMDKENGVRIHNDHIIRYARIKHDKVNYVPRGDRLGIDLPTMSSVANLFDPYDGGE
jgi:hypothetical protein